MSLVINNNMMAANAARTLNTHYGNLATSTQRLSSGLRINSAADDAARLAIRELMRTDIAAYNQGIRNANDAISMIQVVDGALGIIDEKLIRMKELAEQAATGTYDSTQRLMIDSEFQAMASEIQRIATATDFNGIKLIDGKGKPIVDYDLSKITTVPVDEIKNSTEIKYYFNPDNYDSSAPHVGTQALVVTERTLISKGEKTITHFEEDGEIYKKTTNNIREEDISQWTRYTFSGHVDSFEPYYAYTGDYRSRVRILDPKMIDFMIESHPNQDYSNPVHYNQYISDFQYEYVDHPEFEAPNLNGFNHKYTFYCNVLDNSNCDLMWEVFLNQYEDVDFVKDTFDMSYLFYHTFQNAKIGIITTNSDVEIEKIENIFVPPSITIHFGPINDAAEDYYDIEKRDCTLKGLGLDGVRIKTQDNAQEALVTINDAIVKKDQARAYYGGMQNRLENTVSNITIQSENLQASESRISDVDVATEMTNFVRNQILTQSAVAMLSQANSMPQMAMQLIGG